MKLKQKGKYLELPIAGLKIKKMLFDGLLTLCFDDPEESFLQLHSNFKVTRFNGTVICVEDGPYENWHYTRRNGSDVLYVHGGIGSTSY